MTLTVPAPLSGSTLRSARLPGEATHIWGRRHVPAPLRSAFRLPASDELRRSAVAPDITYSTLRTFRRRHRGALC
jgi:hypothetical protein